MRTVRLPNLRRHRHSLTTQTFEAGSRLLSYAREFLHLDGDGAGGQRVLSSGPYATMRHPAYAGSIPTIFGTALAFGSPIAFALVGSFVIPAYLYRIRVEERTMVAGLGAAYASYRARTPALVPRWPAPR